jgi:hypothetical protein
MSAVSNIVHILTSSFFTETSVQNEYLLMPEIITAIQIHNWTILESPQAGWSILRRNILYRD